MIASSLIKEGFIGFDENGDVEVRDCVAPSLSGNRNSFLAGAVNDAVDLLRRSIGGGSHHTSHHGVVDQVDSDGISSRWSAE